MATMTFYPDAGNPGTTSVDGRVYFVAGTPASFTSIRNNAGTGLSATASNEIFAHLDGRNGTTNWQRLDRGILNFDTSALPNDATITSAVLSIYSQGGEDYFSQSLGIVKNNKVFDNQIVNSSYNIVNWDMTLQSDTMTVANWLASTAYKDFTFNATGISNISKTGVSKFGLVLSADYSNTDPGTHTANETYVVGASADGGSNIPKLVVNYTLPTNRFFLLF